MRIYACFHAFSVCILSANNEIPVITFVGEIKSEMVYNEHMQVRVFVVLTFTYHRETG